MTGLLIWEQADLYLYIRRLIKLLNFEHYSCLPKLLRQTVQTKLRLLTLNSEFFARVYFRETFVKIKLSPNDKY